MTSAPQRSQVIRLAQALASARFLLVASLVVGLLLLGLNLYLLGLLRSLDEDARRAAERVALAESAVLRAADAVERGPIEVPIKLEADLPVQTSFRFQQSFQVPVQTEIPLDTTFQVPISTPLGNFEVPLPLKVKVPIDAQVPVAFDQTIPISTTVPISIDQALLIDLRGTELATELRQLRQSLDGRR